MNKKKAVYTSLTALALASFSATTFADEVAETAVAETTVALADEAVVEDTAVEASPEVAATETVAEEEPVAVTALVEEESIFDKSAIQEQFEAGDTSYIAGTWEKEVTEYDTIPHTISISTDSRVTSIAYPKGYSHDFSRITGSTSTNGIVDENTVLIDSGGVSGTFKRVSAEETIFEDIWSWTGLETYDVSPLSDDEFVSALMSDPEFRNKLSGIFVDFKGTHEGTPYHLVYNYDTTGKEEFAYQMNTATSDIFSLVNLPEGTQPVGLGSGPRRFMYVLPDGIIPTLKTQEVVEENEPTSETVDIRSQVESGDFSYFVGTWKNDSGEVVSVSADGTISSALYAAGFKQALSADAGRVGLAGETTASGTVLDKDVLNFVLNKYSGIQERGVSGEGFTGETFWTKVSDEETPYEVVDWSWTGLQRFEESIIGQGDEQTWAGLASQQEYLVTFFGTYNNQGFSLTSTIDKSGVWSILDSFNLAEDDILSSSGGLYGSGYFYLKDGVVPTLKKDAIETVTLTDKNGSEVSVDLLDNEGVANLEVIDHIEPSQVNPAPIARLEGLDYDLYDITLKDAQGNPITTLKAAAIVKLPVDEGKTVERVIYLPENGVAETLAILKQEDGFVYFEASHFSHYGVVYLQTSTATETAETTETEEVVTTPTSSDKAVSTTAKGAGQVAASNTSTPSYSRVARAQAEKALPKTGEATSVLGLIGLGLTTLGTVVSKRRK